MVSELLESQSASSFLVTLPLYVLMLIAETALLCHFVWTVFRKNSDQQLNPLFLRYSVVLICMVLLTLCIELWSIIVGITSTIPSRGAYCTGQMFLRILSFIILECSMCLFWIIRIRGTFIDSVYQVSEVLSYSVFISAPLIALLLAVLLAVYMIPVYYALDAPLKGYGCAVLIHGDNNVAVKFVLLAGQILAFVLNIFFSVLFYHKLSTFQHQCATAVKATAREGKPSDVDLLMQKQSLLALVSTISAMVAYLVFNIWTFTASSASDSIHTMHYGFLLIDIDLVVKSFAMVLMFRFYTGYFVKVCWCCIRVSAVDCSAKCRGCLCCSTVDADDFNKHRPVFESLKVQSSQVRLKLERRETITKYTKVSANVVDSAKYTAADLDEAIGTQFYPVKKLHYEFKWLLVKASKSSSSRTGGVAQSGKLYEFMEDGEEIKDQETLFQEIAKCKSKRQQLTRVRNEKAEYGHVTHENVNVYFRRNMGRYPFVVAVGCDAPELDGYILSHFVLTKMQQHMATLSDKDKFGYESVLQEIVQELKTNTMDQNVLFRFLEDDENEELPAVAPKRNSRKSTAT
mmetsp:Transcript_22709/g.36457  ORF Transcript_22709/g.36457 Transcript_22709/m.36457 type:complete len:573 (+) Transcript_22709:60-1778(+)|eukprot:CAMPEP_0202690076 /NCGR_PEP_ID=MMETSP1385-20130828/5195_1 /ASSEMBLY_ACC=CAM_ASM_000861 /TAXON_ID=933848 /ORGANISM="Elphidium margaritaceum" /LENGTH=572 /DNA_ID=CAMNT_0049345305 /DNA_START=37 /DNA_END=1755 /DNA_ORIENTATION=+